MMSLVAGCEILEEMRTSLNPSWVLHIFFFISCVAWSSVVLFDHLLSVYLQQFFKIMSDPWEINPCFGSNMVFQITSNVLMSPFVVIDIHWCSYSLSVFTEDSISESAPCWRPQRPPASSLEMLHVSTRAAILRQHHKQWWDSMKCNSWGHILRNIKPQSAVVTFLFLYGLCKQDMLITVWYADKWTHACMNTFNWNTLLKSNTETWWFPKLWGTSFVLWLLSSFTDIKTHGHQIWRYH